MKWLKVVGIVLAAFIVLLLGAVLLAPRLVPIKSILAKSIEARLHRPATIGDASFRLLGGLSISVSDLAVEDLPEFGDRPIIKASSFRANISLIPFLFSTLVVEDVELDGLELSVVRSPEGIVNLQLLQSQSSSDNAGQPYVRETQNTNDPEPFWKNPEGDLIIRNATLKNVTCHMENQKTGLSSELFLELFRISGKVLRNRLELACSATMPGFSMEAKGAAENPFDEVTLENAMLAFRLDSGEVGRKFTPLFEGLEIEGIIECSASASGPPNALRADASLRVEDFSLNTESFGGKPISLKDLLWQIGATTNVMSSTATIHRLQILSRSAGIDASINGEMQWPARLDGIAFEASSTIQLNKLTTAMGPLIPGPTTIAGELAGKASFGPAAQGGVAASGSVRIRDLEITHPDSAHPYRDPNVNLDLEALIDPREDRIEVSTVEVSSLPLRLSARGHLSRTDASLGINAKTHFDYVDTILEGLGAIPESTQLTGVGVLTGRIEGTVHTPRVDAKIALADSGILVGRKIRKPRGVPAELRLIGNKSDEAVQLENLELLFGPVQLKASGKAEQESGNVTLLAELAPVDLAGLAKLSPEFAERAPQGKFGFKLRAKGRIDELQPDGKRLLPELDGEVNFQKVSLTPALEGLPVRPVLTGSILADSEQIRLEGMSLVMDRHAISLEGEMKAYRDWPASKARLRVDAEMLDVNTLLSLFPAREPRKKAEDSASGEPSPPTSPESGDSSTHPPGDDAWKNLQASLHVRSERLIYETYDVKDFLLKASLQGGRIDVENLSFSPFGGTFSAQGEADMSEPESDFHLAAEGRNIRVKPNDFLWLKDEVPIFALPLTGLEGTFDFESDLASKGTDLEEIQKNLNGAAKMKAVNGVDVNFGFFQGLSAYGDILKRLLFKKFMPYHFSELDGSYRIENGTVNYDMGFSTGEGSPVARLMGFTVLADGTVEARLKIDKRILGHGFERFLEQDGTLPVKITGKIGDLKPTLQLESEQH